MQKSTKYCVIITIMLLPSAVYACGLAGHINVGEHVEGYCDTANNKGEKLICEKTDKHTWWCDRPKHKWGSTLQNAASKACECKKTHQSDIASKEKGMVEQIGSQ